MWSLGGGFCTVTASSNDFPTLVNTMASQEGMSYNKERRFLCYCFFFIIIIIYSAVSCCVWIIWGITFYFNGSQDWNSATSERSHAVDRSKYGNLEIKPLHLDTSWYPRRFHCINSPYMLLIPYHLSCIGTNYPTRSSCPLYSGNILSETSAYVVRNRTVHPNRRRCYATEQFCSLARNFSALTGQLDFVYIYVLVILSCLT